MRSHAKLYKLKPQTVVTQHLHMLQGESHVSRGPILLFTVYAPCHVSLNVRIKVKRTPHNNSSYRELGPPVGGDGRDVKL